MASHGVARGPRTRTDEQKRLDGERIRKYRELEEQLRQSDGHGADVFALTTRLLRLNPEYYTVWNVRRRCLISGLLSRRRSGLPCSAGSSSLSASAATPSSTAGSLPTSSDAIPPNPSSTGPTPGSCEGEAPEAGKDAGRRDAETTTSEARTPGAQETPAPKAARGQGTQDARDTDDAAQHESDRQVLTDELLFTIPLLMEFPKCYWIWSYRLWVLQQAVQRLDAAAVRRIWQDELALVSKMLTKDRRNFHAWGYRRQVVEQLESPSLQPAGSPPVSLVEAEFAYTTKMVHMDLSNFSAWHNRSKLIPRLLDERQADDEARKCFLDTELGIIREALNVGPEDQSLWFYHQFLMLNLTDYTGRSTITPNFDLEERMTYITRELNDIKDLLLDYDDVKWIYEALLEYTIDVAKMLERPLDPVESADVRTWLNRLRALDPMRSGRWDDLEAEWVLGRRRSEVEV